MSTAGMGIPLYSPGSAAAGATGPAGVGTTGATGVSGATGPGGGPTGPTGVQGATGPAGVSGATGAGVTGATGPGAATNAYGVLTIIDTDSAAVTLTNQNQFYVVPFAGQGATLNTIPAVGANANIQVLSTGVYAITGNLSIKCTSQNHNFIASVFINGVQATDLTDEVDNLSNADSTPITIAGVRALTANDIISLRVECTDTTGRVLSVVWANLSVYSTSGVQGAVGPTGPTGPTGVGTTGATGVIGVSGATGPAGVSGATGVIGVSGATGAAGSSPGCNAVATNESRNNGSYGDLATSGPAVTITTGTTALLLFSAEIEVNSAAGNQAWVSPAVSGATTVAASDANGLTSEEAIDLTSTVTRVLYMTGLTAGSNTFTLKYRTATNNANFANRTLAVVPL